MKATPPFSIENRKDKFSRHVIYAVHGFWSGDTVRVSQHRYYRDGKWQAPGINWSTGGRDLEKEPDDATAADCLAQALTDAVKVARKWGKEV